MQVHRNEGVAIHIGPEPCAVGCEAALEALTGDRVGQPFRAGSRCVHTLL